MEAILMNLRFLKKKLKTVRNSKKSRFALSAPIKSRIWSSFASFISDLVDLLSLCREIPKRYQPRYFRIKQAKGAATFG